MHEMSDTVCAPVTNCLGTALCVYVFAKDVSTVSAVAYGELAADVEDGEGDTRYARP